MVFVELLTRGMITPGATCTMKDMNDANWIGIAHHIASYRM